MITCLRGIKKVRGFTLIELLVVIGILAILLSIVLIAINPARQFNQANNTKRRSDVTALLNAISQYGADHKGTLPANISATGSAEIANTGADICSDILLTYIPALPVDPEVNNGTPITSCTTYATGYNVSKDANNRVTVSAPGAKLDEIIAITR